MTFTEETIPGDASPLTVSGSSTTGAGKQCTVVLSGGTAGNIYKVANKIVTDETTPQTEVKFVRVVVKERSF